MPRAVTAAVSAELSDEVGPKVAITASFKTAAISKRDHLTHSHGVTSARRTAVASVAFDHVL